jgi:hypothetical protein
MAKRLLFLVNRSPTEANWMRSNEEFDLQKKICPNLFSLITLYLRHSLGAEGFIYSIDGKSLEKQRYLEFMQPGTTLINFCSGSDLDGLVGPSLSMSLEKQKVCFIGPSSDFLINTIDKKKMREILQMAQIPTKTFEILKVGDHPKLQYPLVIRPADSYIPTFRVVKNGAELFHLFLESSFSLFIAEQYNQQEDYQIFVQGCESYCDLDVSEEAIKIARSAYYVLHGSGLAVVEIIVDKDGVCVRDVRIIGALELFHQKFGIDKTLQMMNKMLQIGVN